MRRVREEGEGADCEAADDLHRAEQHGEGERQAKRAPARIAVDVAVAAVRVAGAPVLAVRVAVGVARSHPRSVVAGGRGHGATHEPLCDHPARDRSPPPSPLSIAGRSQRSPTAPLPAWSWERPADVEHGDYATSVAMRLARQLKRPPRQIAEEIAQRIQGDEIPAAIEIAGPGFLNLRMAPSWYRSGLARILAAGPAYGRGQATAQRRTWSSSRRTRRAASRSARRGTARTATAWRGSSRSRATT